MQLNFKRSFVGVFDDGVKFHTNSYQSAAANFPAIGVSPE